MFAETLRFRSEKVVQQRVHQPSQKARTLQSVFFRPSPENSTNSIWGFLRKSLKNRSVPSETIVEISFDNHSSRKSH